MRQQFANPIFSSLANKFPKRFNALFELRILVQNSLKNMYFLTIKLISHSEVDEWTGDEC